MKLVIFYLMIAVVCFAFIQCHEEKDTDKARPADFNMDTLTFTHSMKGWELYSWQQGARWHFSILTGTNRNKTYEEVVQNKISVLGVDSLKMLLNKLPAGEYVFWNGQIGQSGAWIDKPLRISLPSGNVIQEIEAYCSARNLILAILR